MDTRPPAWIRQVRELLRARGVDELVSTRPAVVLERIAYGGGDTHWYRIDRTEQLDELAEMLRPGSDVRFVFAAGAFVEGPFDDEMAKRVDAIARRDRDAVILARADTIRLERDFPSSAAEAAEFVAEEAPDGRVWVGAYPGRDDDGVDAIRLDIPDDDGVVRGHPH